MGDAAAARMLASFTLAGFVSTETKDLKAIAPPHSTGPVVASRLGDAVHTNNTERAVQLLLTAAMHGDARACLSLSNRYRFGRGTPQSQEAAAWYAKCAAAIAKDEFHTPGEQTFVELNRITDETVADGTVDDNQRGDEDAQLQAQMQRAEEGDIEACVASGDLLYWGARGFQRDHERARRFFKVAADADHAHARCLYASMLLRGEGGDTNHAEAVRQYEVAAAAGSAKALNGLGYEYFYGNHLQKNATKAYGYFAEAARLDADGDSNFNAAHCLAHGIGVEKNVKEAARLYERAATRHGHFDAAFEIALVKHEGSGRTGRDVNRAREFFEACARAGWAARDVRAGFDAYLRGDPGRALLWYAEAAETGTDVAAANAAWLLDRDSEVRALVGNTMPLAVRFHRLASTLDGGGDGYAALGDAVLNGALVVPPGVDEGRAVSDDTISRLLETRHARALSYYSRAAQKGSARGAFAAARVRSKGAPGVPRDRKLAHKLFDDALKADPERMRWPVFLARAQLRCEEFWDDLRGSSPRRRGASRTWLSVGVAVLVVVVSVVRAVASSGGAAPVPEVVPPAAPVAVEGS